MNLKQIKKKHEELKRYLDLRKYMFVVVLFTLLAFLMQQYLLTMCLIILGYLTLVLQDKYKNILFN